MYSSKPKKPSVFDHRGPMCDLICERTFKVRKATGLVEGAKAYSHQNPQNPSQSLPTAKTFMFTTPRPKKTTMRSCSPKYPYRPTSTYAHFFADSKSNTQFQLISPLWSFCSPLRSPILRQTKTFQVDNIGLLSANCLLVVCRRLWSIEHVVD